MKLERLESAICERSDDEASQVSLEDVDQGATRQIMCIPSLSEGELCLSPHGECKRWCL